MRRTKSGFAAAVCLLGVVTASAPAAVSVTHVGANPYNGFSNTGGTGAIASQQPGMAMLAKSFTSLGDVPIIIHSEPSAGVDILHIDETVTNNTGVAWTDFHFVVELIDANPALHVEFMDVMNPTGEWTSIQPSDNALTLLGNVPAGDSFELSIHLHITSQAGSHDLFGIHETPSIPEPSTLALLVCGVFCFLRPGARTLLSSNRGAVGG